MYYPLTIVDDFFDDFDGICKFADNIKWKKQERYTMPGLIADDLTELNPMLKIRIANKILRLYYHRHASYSYVMHSAKFYKITPYGKEYDNKGWVHRDDDNILSALIYIKVNKEHGMSDNEFEVVFSETQHSTGSFHCDTVRLIKVTFYRQVADLAQTTSAIS